MTELWRMGSGSARDVHAALNAREPRQRAYTTVLSVLTRLYEKGLLERKLKSRAHIYTPTLTEAEYSRERAGAEVDALIDHFGDAALAHFVQAVDRLDGERMDALRRLAGEPPAEDA